MGGSTARQTAEMANGNIPYHGRCARLMKRVGQGGRDLSFSSLEVQTFSGNSGFRGSVIAAQGLATNWLLGGEKNCIVYMVCFAQSLLSLLLLLLSILIVVSVFRWLSLSQPTGFPFCPFLLPVVLGGKGRGERAAVWYVAAACWVKAQQQQAFSFQGQDYFQKLF